MHGRRALSTVSRNSRGRPIIVLAGLLIAFAVLLVGATYPATAAAAPQTVASCPFHGGGGDFLNRGFYVTNYAGTNIDKVTLGYDADATGTYMITLTARSGSYSGPVIGTRTVSVSLPNSSPSFTNTQVSFPFNGASVALGSTITFSQSATGPGTLVFDAGNDTPFHHAACPGVTETNGTTPPLDTSRRATVGLIITQFRTACVVPNLKGKTLKKARNELRRFDCKLGKVKGDKPGHVKNQRPEAGSVLALGSKVKVTLD